MNIQNFRTAVKRLGNYCPDNNELRVHKGRKIYRFTCSQHELRVSASAQPKMIFRVAPYPMVHELKNAIGLIVDWHEIGDNGSCA